MLTKLIRNMAKELAVTVKEAYSLIDSSTEKLYVCRESTTYNAKLIFITGEEITVSVETLFKDKQ